MRLGENLTNKAEFIHWVLLSNYVLTRCAASLKINCQAGRMPDMWWRGPKLTTPQTSFIWDNVPQASVQ